MSEPENEPTASGTKRRSTNDQEVESKVPKKCEDGSPEDNVDPVTVELIQTAFQGDTSTYRLMVENSDGEIDDPRLIMSKATEKIKLIIKNKLKKLLLLKIVINLHGCFIDNQYNEFEISDTVEIHDAESIDEKVQYASSVIVSKFDAFNQANEGAKQLLHLDLHVNRHKNIDKTINIPDHVKSHVVSVSSQDYYEYSFKWAVLAALHPEIYKPKDYTLEEFSDELILTDIKHPVKLCDIPKIEEMNDMSFNVYIMKYNHKPQRREEVEGPVYHTSRRRENHFNLLLIQNESFDHYCYIKDLKSLVDSGNRGHFCDGCMNFFQDIGSFKKHQENECLGMKTVLPNNDESIMKFKSDEHVMPIVIYADFEAYLDPVEDSANKKRTRTENDTFTRNINKHVPYSVGYYIKCLADEDLSELKIYYGTDCAEVFIKMLRTDIGNICKQLDFKDVVVPVFFHNFSNYDSYFVRSVLDSVPGRVNGLGTKHKFIAVHKSLTFENVEFQLRFLDSMIFLKSSLESLAENLAKEQFIESRKHWGSGEKFDLMTQKGSLPYEYIKSIEILEQTSLPPKELFYSSVNDKDISDEDYERAKEVWNLFGCETIRDYSMLYLKSDVLILADVFENLRRVCLDTYKLDPANYYAISGLSWDAMLQKTGIELELLTDIEMVIFIRKAKRSGIAHCTRRHAVANNEYLSDQFDKNKEKSFIVYYDANNLYGWAMSQPLPYGGFEWVKNCSVEWVEEHITNNFPAESEIGYFLEVDLEYPEKLHDEHADFPCCPEKKVVNVCDGSRLVTDMTSKERYILHHSYLIQCCRHGLVLKNVHRVLRFKQRPWLKTYMDFNTDMRKNAETQADKDFFKLLNNVIFGKSIQNTEKYFELKIVDHWFNIYRKQGGHTISAKADYHSHAVMSDDSVAFQMNKTKYEFKLPIYIGICVYDISKSHMYDFHYNFMKKQYGDKLKLLYTDTDSLIYQIFTDDYYNEMKDKLDERFDTSDYPESSLFQSQKNKKKVGCFKDELNGVPIKEFIALRPKVYMIDAAESSIKKAAGVALSVSRKFTIDDYKQSLFNQEKIYREWTRIQPVESSLFTQRIRKVVLSPAYTNRHVLDNLIDTLPFGHYSLNEK